MKQSEKRISLKLENTLGLGKEDVRVRMSVHPKVLYQGKPLDLTSIFNLVKSRTPLYYMSEDQKDNFCKKFIPAKLVYEQDKNGNETVVLYDVDGTHWSTYLHRALYTDRQEAFDEWYQKQMRLIEKARTKLLELERREENIELQETID